MATTGETAPVPNTNNGGTSEGAEQKEQFVGNRFYARSIGSDIGPSSNSSVQIIRHDSFRIDFFIDAYHFLEIQLIPFSKRLFVRLNRFNLLDLYRFSKLERVEEVTDGGSVILEFEDGICSCNTKGKKRDDYFSTKCDKHFIIADCNMDVFSTALLELGKHLDEHWKAMQHENNRIIEMYEGGKRNRHQPHFINGYHQYLPSAPIPQPPQDIKDDRKGLLYKIQWHNRHFNRLSNLWILLLHQRNLQARIKRLRFHGRRNKEAKEKDKQDKRGLEMWVPE